MELRHLRYFAAVAAHGNFSRAAQNLHLTQPALSRQVKDLEDEIGVPLLVRGANAVTLTNAGEQFYEEARDLLARADQAVQRARGELRREVLRVGYGPSLTTGILPQAIEKFQSVAPRAQIELADLSPGEMAGKVRDGLLDLVIMPSGMGGAMPGIQWMELRRMALALILSPRHPLARLKRIPPARLRDVGLHALGRDNFPEYGPRLKAAFKPYGFAPRIDVYVNDGVAPLFAAVEASGGAAILADGIASVLPRTLEIRHFSPALPGAIIQIGMPAVRPNPHAETFARLLREAAGSAGPRSQEA